jgi:integrase
MRYLTAANSTNSGITFTPHDLRRTFATVAESHDLSWKTVKALLNHKMEDDVTAGYVVSDAERLRAAMQIITDTLKVYCGIDKSPKQSIAKKKRDPKVVEISSHRKPG